MALGILAKCLQSDPALLERSVGGLREALQHPSVDVQEAALDVLEGAGEVSGDPDVLTSARLRRP